MKKHYPFFLRGPETESIPSDIEEIISDLQNHFMLTMHKGLVRQMHDYLNSEYYREYFQLKEYSKEEDIITNPRIEQLFQNLRANPTFFQELRSACSVEEYLDALKSYSQEPNAQDLCKILFFNDPAYIIIFNMLLESADLDNTDRINFLKKISLKMNEDSRWNQRSGTPFVVSLIFRSLDIQKKPLTKAELMGFDMRMRSLSDHPDYPSKRSRRSP